MINIFSSENVVKNYSRHRALTNVSISIPKGYIFGLLGPNGAGKTTLLRIINQITAPDSGKLFFDGRPMRPNDVYRIGYLPEERGLYRKMKVGDQALYLARLKGLSRRDAMKRLKVWFEKFEITTWWNRKVMELSKGMQQKIQFICTILHEPDLLIFDEPFSGFDPVNAELLKQEIVGLRDRGATIIFATHNMTSVEELCDHIALINKSEKILDGATQEIREKYKSNIFEVEYKGNFNYTTQLAGDDFKVLSHTQKKYINHLQVQLPKESTPARLLSILSKNMDMRSFNEVVPSMNDVFIKVVTEHSN